MKISYLLTFTLTILLSIGMKSIETNEDPWQEVYLLERKRQFKTAIERVQVIQSKALQENDLPNKVKSELYLIKYKEAIKDETSDFSKVTSFDKLIKNSSTEIEKSLYHFYKAQMLKNYYNNNRRNIGKRSSIVGEKFDLDKSSSQSFSKEIEKHYLESLEYNNALKDCKNKEWETLLEHDVNKTEFLTNLYEVILYEIINYSRSNIIISEVYWSQIPKEWLYLDANSFRNLGNIKIGKFDYIFKAYQNLLTSVKDNESALIYFEERRLSFLLRVLDIKKHTEEYKKTWELFFDRYKSSSIKNLPYFKKIQLTLNTDTKIAADSIYQELISQKPKEEDEWWGKIYNLMHSEVYAKSTRITFQETPYPDRPILAKIEYKNVAETELTIYKVDDFDDYIQYKDLKFQEWKQKKTIFRKVKLELPSYSDYNTHNAELLLDALPHGHYIVAIQGKITQLRVSKHTTVNFKTKSENYIALSDIETGVFYKNAPLNLYITKNNKFKSKSTLKTEDDFRFDIKGLKADYRSRCYVEVPGTAVFHEVGSGLAYRPNSQSYSVVELFKDRGVYKLGQQIHFKGIALAYENHKSLPTISENKSVKVTFYDPNHKVLFQETMFTNEYGSISGVVNIPKKGMNGVYYLYLNNKRHNIPIESYVRPKFEIKWEESNAEIELDKEMTLKADVLSYAGFPIDEAKVRFEVKRSQFYSWRPFWCFAPPIKNISKDIILESNTVTNKDGEAFLTFTPKASKVDWRWRPGFTFDILIEVTDINGETQTSTKSVTVYKDPVLSSISIDEIIEVSALDSIAYSITNTNNIPVDRNGKIIIERVDVPEDGFKYRNWSFTEKRLFTKSELQKHYPYLAYEESQLNPSNWNTIETILERKVSGLNNKIKCPKLKPGAYRILLKTEGVETEISDLFFVWQKGKPLPNQMPISLLLADEQVSLNKKVEVNLLNSINGAELLLSTQDINHSTSFELIKTKNGQHDIKQHLSAENRGKKYIIFMSYRGMKIKQELVVFAPYDEKKINIKVNTFRDKMLPGAKESMSFSFFDHLKKPIQVEGVATLYDKSLDDIYPHYFPKFDYPPNYIFFNLSVRSESYYGFSIHVNYQNKYINTSSPLIQKMKNIFNQHLWLMDRRYRSIMAGSPMSMEKTSTSAPLDESVSITADMDADGVVNAEEPNVDSPQQIRENLGETVFYKPHIKSNEKGETNFSFLMNDALTTWKFKMFVHSTDADFGYIEKEIVTQKKLMVVPQLPRFARSGDKLIIRSKIVNLTDKAVSVIPKISLETILGKSLNKKWNISKSSSINIKANQSEVVSWEVNIPENFVQPISMTISASSTDYSDAEKKLLPILSDKKLINESKAFYINAETTKTIDWKRLDELGQSKTLIGKNLNLQIIEHPIWYALQSLPYINVNKNNANAESLMSSYFGNAIGLKISNQFPKLSNAILNWEITNPEEFVSLLNQNQDFKNIVVEETPWLVDANHQTDQMQKIKLLLDSQHANDKLDELLLLLEDLQLNNGAFSWFEGGRASVYITQNIMIQLIRLKELEAIPKEHENRINQITSKGFDYCWATYLTFYNTLKGKDKDFDSLLNGLNLNLFYIKSALNRKDENEASKMFKKALKEKWTDYLSNLRYTSMIGELFLSWNEEKLFEDVVKSLRESAIYKDEEGMYWKTSRNRYYWYQRPIVSHVWAMNLLSKAKPIENEINLLSQWLLVSKRTQNWGTSTATSAAIYALLKNGDDLFFSPKKLVIKEKGNKFGIEKSIAAQRKSPILGKLDISLPEKDPSGLEIEIKNPNSTQSWGSINYQYIEKIENLTAYENDNLKIEKELYRKVVVDNKLMLEPLKDNTIQIGDELVLKMIISADRDYSYVHLSDMRAAGLEPTNNNSGYRWDAGLGYYQDIKDQKTNFFFDRLPKGIHTFEYNLRATVEGVQSNGISTIQCMFAPEYNAHSAGEYIRIEESKK